MSTELGIREDILSLAERGAYGSKVVPPIVANKFVTSTNMKATAYTIAAQPVAPCRVTCLVTAQGGADTLGNLVIVGTLEDDTACTESVALTAGTTASSVNCFKTLTSLTTPSWVINSTNDTIVIGSGAVAPFAPYFEADDDRIVASANMKVGAYTIVAQPQYPTTLTVTATASGTADTMGTLLIAGHNAKGETITETVVPSTSGVVTTTSVFADVTRIVGAGWVVDGGAGNDTIKVGVSAVQVPATYYFSHIRVLAAAVAASQTSPTGATVANLTKFTSIPVGLYPVNLTSIALTSGEAIAYQAPL